MARRKARRNRMPAGLARYWAKHRRGAKRNPARRRRHVMRNSRRRRARRNYTSAGLVAMNPRRRRHHARRNPRRHRARRNPGTKFMGFTLPPTMDIVMVSSGMIVSPMLANYVFNSFVAGTSMGTSKWAYLGVEAVSVAALGFAAKKFLGPKSGFLLMLGGGARLVIDAITMLAPSMLPSTAMPTGLSGAGAIGQPFLGYYNRMPQRRNLGFYNRGPQGGANKGGAMIQNIPARLDPSFRF